MSSVRPNGTIFLFVNIKPYKMKSLDLAIKLVEEARIVSLPGTEFGPYGEGYLRLSTCVNREQIETGIAGLTEFAREFE
jgi:aspartate/methionine/tyrosine aminotransferase